MLPLTRKQGGTSPAPYASLVHALKSIHYVLIIDPCLAGLVQLIGKDVEHQFTVTLGVDMSVCFDVEEAFEIGGIDQVAILDIEDVRARLSRIPR